MAIASTFFTIRSPSTASASIPATTIFSPRPARTDECCCSTWGLPTMIPRWWWSIEVHFIPWCSIPSTTTSWSQRTRRRAPPCGTTARSACRWSGTAAMTPRRAAWVFASIPWAACCSPSAVVYLPSCIQRSTRIQSANSTIKIITTRAPWRAARSPVPRTSSCSPDPTTSISTFGRCRMLIVSPKFLFLLESKFKIC